VASTINSVPDGIIFTADSTGALNIQANGINAIQIGSSGSAVIGSLVLSSINAGSGITGGAQDYIVQSYGII
jgi:selenocysteine lyase/cysteine desulfurase